MNGLDYVCGVIMALAGLRCWFRGIVTEVMSMAALVGGLLSAIFFGKTVGAWLSNIKPLGKLELMIGFIVAFALVFIAFKFLEKTMRDILENLEMDIVDSALGFMFGLVEGFIVSALIIMLLRYQPVFNVQQLLEGSLFARFIIPIVTNAMNSHTSAVIQLPSFGMPCGKEAQRV